MLQLTLGLLFTQGINIDSVLRVYTIASGCWASRLQEMEFSLKAFIYLPDRNAAASASAVLCGHSEDTVCSCTLKRRGKTLCREAVDTYRQQPHQDPARIAQRGHEERLGNAPTKRF